MWRLWHVPFKYHLPNVAGGEQLYRELNEKGYIDLDRDGEPACLSGKPAVLKGD